VIECIFTLDYEIYGNGGGSLRQLVYEPTERLRAVFLNHGARFVPFVEVAELELIEAHGSDPAIDLVQAQLRRLYADGFAPGLHLHPQWYNGRYENGRWVLDYREYNLCSLSKERITHIVDRALEYLRRVLCAPGFAPLSFRAGNWLFQPTLPAAQVLADRGIKLDSSVFKGGVRHQHQLDYRRALKNGYYWRFTEHVDVASPTGCLTELPIHTQMVPFWKMGTSKRIALERQNLGKAVIGRKGLYRVLDASRLWHPLKFDFCRMTFDELTRMIGDVIARDRRDPASFKPLVAIGHTKELADFETIAALLGWLHDRGIKVSTFDDVYPRCAEGLPIPVVSHK
jgi:hypothetical protein